MLVRGRKELVMGSWCCRFAAAERNKPLCSLSALLGHNELRANLTEFLPGLDKHLRT